MSCDIDENGVVGISDLLPLLSTSTLSAEANSTMKQLILTLLLIGPSMVFAQGPNEMLVVEYEVEYDLSWKFKPCFYDASSETMTIYYSDYGKRVESHDELAAGMTNSTTIISNYNMIYTSIQLSHTTGPTQP